MNNKEVLQHSGIKTNNKNHSARGNIMLIIAALIWGTSFVAQSVGMEYVGPFTFNAVRSFIGSAALVPFIFLFDRIGFSPKKMNRTEKLFLIKGGVICGFIVFAASSLQQIGIKYTTAGKAGFLTALYIVILPIIGLFLKKRSGFNVYIAVVIAVCGMYLLCIKKESVSLNYGDIMVIGCAFFYSLHIIVIDYFAPKTDCVRLSCIQFLINGIISSVFMFIFEKPDLNFIIAARVPILYSGLLSSGIAFTFQIIAQRYTKPVVASLLMSLESVFAVLAGWLVLKEVLSMRELFGCILIFAAVILAQLPLEGILPFLIKFNLFNKMPFFNKRVKTKNENIPKDKIQ